jgi:hypothetical protein
MKILTCPALLAAVWVAVHCHAAHAASAANYARSGEIKSGSFALVNP